MNYWLMKTEPDAYSWDDLKSEPKRTDHWDGIRNYAARIHLRNMKKGDLVFFYHSQVKPPCIVGIAKVVKEAYPDFTQFDSSAKYYDPKSSEDNPRWDMVDIQAIQEFKEPVTLHAIKATAGLEEMALLKISRLSVSPVRESEWNILCKMATIKKL